MGAPTVQTAIKQWTALITAAFRRRIRPDQLTEAFTEQWTKSRIPGVALVSIVLTSGAPISSGVDPLVPAYVDELLKVTSLDLCDVMVALLANSRYAVKNAGGGGDSSPIVHDLLLLESIFALLSRSLVHSGRPRTAKESRRAVRALTEWITACCYNETMLQVQADNLRAPEPSVISAFETIGAFAVSLLTNEPVKRDIERSWPKGWQSWFRVHVCPH